MSNRKRQPTAWATECREWRKRVRLTQIEAAEHLSIPEKTYEGWEQSRTVPVHQSALRALMAKRRPTQGREWLSGGAGIGALRMRESRPRRRGRAQAREA